MLIIDPDEGLKIVLCATVIIGQFGIPGAIDGGRKGHDLSPSKRCSAVEYNRRDFFMNHDEPPADEEMIR